MGCREGSLKKNCVEAQLLCRNQCCGEMSDAAWGLEKEGTPRGSESAGPPRPGPGVGSQGPPGTEGAALHAGWAGQGLRGSWKGGVLSV